MLLAKLRSDVMPTDTDRRNGGAENVSRRRVVGCGGMMFRIVETNAQV
jgi:hypothetical protein